MSGMRKKIDWNYKFDKRDGDELYFKKGNAINFFEENKEFISDIYFFRNQLVSSMLKK